MERSREKDLIEALARNMRLRRAALGLSQEDLAERSGLDRTYVSGCERGIRNPTVATLSKLAMALEVSAASLIDVEATSS